MQVVATVSPSLNNLYLFDLQKKHYMLLENVSMFIIQTLQYSSKLAYHCSVNKVISVQSQTGHITAIGLQPPLYRGCGSNLKMGV